MYMKNIEFIGDMMDRKLQQFFEDRSSSKSTQNHYNASVKLYEDLNKKSLSDLIREADLEEENAVRWKNRLIRERLIHYRNYLFSNKAEGTAKLYLNDIKTIYRHFEIELQSLPSFNSHQIDKTYEMDFEDLVNKNELIDAYHEANNVTKCIILFALSSGFSKVDLLNLTVNDFINACDKYLTEEELYKQLQELKNQDEVIPTFKGRRQKTDKKFITFCSPEASEHIIQYLLGRDAHIREVYEVADEDEQEELSDRLYYSDKLFDVSSSHLNYSLRRINNKLQLGNVGKFTKFRCHVLRKYQASTLLNCQDIQWTVEEIDTLQGRSKDKTHRAYFHDDSEKLWQKYYDSVDDLMLFKSIHQIDAEAYDKLEKENKFYKKEIVKNETKLEEQQKTINQIISNQRELEALLGL